MRYGAEIAPDQITASDVLEYPEIRAMFCNGASAVNRSLVVLRRFYGAMVAMGHLDQAANPLIGFPLIKAVPRKLPALSRTGPSIDAGPEADP